MSEARKDTAMKAVVDLEACVGCGLCAETCPEVFEMDGDLARVTVETVPAEHEASCKEATDACPVNAIRLEE